MTNPLAPQFPNPFGFVASDMGPGNVKNIKRIIDLSDLSSFAPGTTLNLGLTGEVQLFADMPVDVTFGDAPEPSRGVSQVAFIGRVNSLVVRRRTVLATTVGHLVLYTGVPFLGSNWTREDPKLKVALPGGADAEAWPLGTTTLDSINTIAMPSTIAQDAHYLISLNAVRSGGTLERVQFIESETGSNLRLFDYAPAVVSDRIEYNAPFPIRLPSAGAFRFIGSNEAAGTTLSYHTELVGI